MNNEKGMYIKLWTEDDSEGASRFLIQTIWV